MSYRNSNTARMQPRVQPRLRVPWAPAEPTAVVPRSVPWLAAVAGGLLMLATFGWGFAGTALSHGMADYQEWAGRDAMRKGEPAIVAQHDWQHALRLQPQNPELRLDLARSYLDQPWLGGAIDQAQAVLDRPHTRAQASLAYAYMGYAHLLLGEKAKGQAELELAVDYDRGNSVAQTLLERVQRGLAPGSLPQ